MIKKGIDCSDLIGTYDIKGANEVIEILKGRIEKYYEDLKHNLIEQLFHLSDEEAKDCIREFIKDHPEILNRYTKDELLEL